MKILLRSGIAILLLLFLYSCKKESEHPQWDVEAIGPLAKASLGLNNFFADTLLTSDSEGLLHVHYDTTLSSFNLDSIYTLKDTTISSVQVFPPFPAVISPGTVFPNNNNIIRLSTGSVLLKRADISSGFIRIKIKNTLRSKINFNYQIPKAKRNGIPFSFSAAVDSGSVSSPTYFSRDFDFSGYSVDLTGNSGADYNVLYFDVTATTNPSGQSFNLIGSDTIFNIETSLLSIKPSYVKGYLGEDELDLNSSSNFGIGEIIKSGMVSIDSVKMQLDIVNSIGADGQAILGSLSSFNSVNTTTVQLLAPSLIGQLINITRAIDQGTGAAPSTRTFILDKSNSNITDWIQNLPDRYSYDLRVHINPQGNISGSNDFVYSDQLLKTRIQLDLPLKIGMDRAVITDTIDLNLEKTTDFTRIGFTTLTVRAENGFPFDMDMQLILLDSQNNIMDTLLVPGLIQRATCDANRKVIQSEVTRLVIPVDETRKNLLVAAQKMCIRAKLSTPSYPDLYPLYSNYRLNVRIIADGIYSIR